MKNTKRKHSDSFKTEVALDAIRERKALYELAQEYPTTSKSNMEHKSHYTLQEIACWAENKNVSLPKVQRGFVWKPAQIENLWDSLLRGYPVGAFVLSNAAKETLHILDGQQRATAICLGFAKSTFRDSQEYYNVYVDLEPPKANDARKFIIRVITKSHPWGYRKQDNTKTLTAENIRKAMDLYKDVSDPLKVPLKKFFPFDADMPVPLHYFLNAAGEKHEESKIIAKVKEFQHWPLIVGNWKEKHIKNSNGVSESDIESTIDTKIINIYNAVKEMLNPDEGQKIPALYMNLEKVMNLEKEEAEDASDEVENLFVRLNSGGTQLSGEELNYSILKAHLDREVQDKIEEACKPLFKPARFITVAFRLYQQDIKEVTQSDALTMRIKPKQFQRIMRQKNETGIHKKSFEAYISELIEDNVFQGHTLLQYAKSILEYDATKLKHYGLPFLIYSKISEVAPELMFLLLYRIKYRGDRFSWENLAAETEHRTMLGILTSFIWFGKGENQKDHTKLLANIWPKASKETKENFWSADTVQSAFHGESFPRLKEQNSISNNIESRDIILAEFLDTPPFNEKDKNEKDKLFLQKIIYNRSLILYAQRHFIENYFSKEQYELEDTALPFDWDHISPNNFVKHKKNKSIPPFVKEWYQTNGNFRAWPYALNRMDNDDSPSVKLNPLNQENKSKEFLTEKWNKFIKEKSELIENEGQIHQKLIEWSFCRPDWCELPNITEKNHWNLVTQQIIYRNFYIIKEWYDQLKIDELHSKNTK